MRRQKRKHDVVKRNGIIALCLFGLLNLVLIFSIAKRLQLEDVLFVIIITFFISIANIGILISLLAIFLGNGNGNENENINNWLH